MRARVGLFVREGGDWAADEMGVSAFPCLSHWHSCLCDGTDTLLARDAAARSSLEPCRLASLGRRPCIATTPSSRRSWGLAKVSGWSVADE